MTRFSGTKRGPFDGRCGICGCRTYGDYCASHRDLAQLERDLMPSTRTEPAAPRDKSATGSIRKEA